LPQPPRLIHLRPLSNLSYRRRIPSYGRARLPGQPAMARR
jgi:hypothetical protein